MTAFPRPTRHLLALALALAATPALADAPFSNTVFFGDSLTDTGFYRPLLPASVQAVTGQFTTNPGWVWSQYLADYYGTEAKPNGNGQAGSNYAAGGARVAVDSTGALGAVPSLATQVGNYLASTGGKADPNALYTVWGGANDLFAVTAGANPTTTIGTAVSTEVGLVGQLQGAGARYVMVFNIPDLGLTPSFRAQGAVAQATGTQLASTYNAALFSGLSGAGLKVIPVDTFHVLQEIVAAPNAYGFTNVTGTACQPQITANSLTCNPTSYVTPNASSTYVFADGVHPTVATHAMLAQYAISVIEGPRLQQVLTHSAQVTGRARADQVAWHRAGAEAVDGLSWWGNLRGDLQRYGHGDLYDGPAPAGLFGLDWTRGAWTLGGFAGYGRVKADFGKSQGDFTQKDTTLGVFAAWQDANLWVNAQVGYSWLGYDVHRQVVLGPVVRRHDGSPDGSNLTAALNAGYVFGQGRLQHGPVAGLTWQKVKRDGYVESNLMSSALAYDDTDADSLVGRIGWQASYALNDMVTPYIQATYDHEFKDASEATARLQTLPEAGTYAVPGIDFDRNYGSVVLGARTRLFGLDTNLGASLTPGQKGGKDTSLFASFSGRF